MSQVVGALDVALASNRLEQVSMIMDRFETQTANLGVQTHSMESAMAGSAALTTPEDQVMNLIQQVAADADLELKEQLWQPTETVSTVRKSQQKDEVGEEESLAERLAKLRNAQ